MTEDQGDTWETISEMGDETQKCHQRNVTGLNTTIKN